MKKILIVSSSLDTGGAQKMISNITTSLPENWEADILLNSDRNIQFPYKGTILSLDIPEPKSRTNLLYQGKVLLKRLKMLLRLKRKNHYIACVSLLDSANVANIITGKKYCKTVVTAVVNMSESRNIKAYKYIVFPLIKLFYNRASHIIAQNSAIRDDLIQNFGLKENLFTIIYNGIDCSAIERICQQALPEKENQWFSKERTVITAGRLTYAKGQWHLIRAFHKVLSQRPDAKLVLFGEGELREYLQRLIEDYQMKDSVCIRSFDSELDKYIASSAVFVLPSMIEGMPTVLLEAMACAVTSVVTDFQSGAREIMDYTAGNGIEGITETDYGFIVPVCSGKQLEAGEPLEETEEILAQVILDILEKPSLRDDYSQKAKMRSRFFSMDSLIEQWIAVFEKE